MSISKSDVREGDVLLLMESGIGPALIALLDDGIYSHSAYFNGTDVVGCVLVGLVSQSLDDVLADTDWMYIDIYRFVDGKGGEMGSPDLPAAPVSAVCNAYVKEGVSYATNYLYFYWVLILLPSRIHTQELRSRTEQARAEVRAAAVRDPDWQEFLKNGPEMIEDMQSMILLPSAHSPMK